MEAAKPKNPIDTASAYMEKESPVASEDMAIAKTHMISSLREPYLSANMPEGIAPIPKSA